jgi:hypothetical protein
MRGVSLTTLTVPWFHCWLVHCGPAGSHAVSIVVTTIIIVTSSHLGVLLDTAYSLHKGIALD